MQNAPRLWADFESLLSVLKAKFNFLQTISSNTFTTKVKCDAESNVLYNTDVIFTVIAIRSTKRYGKGGMYIHA